MSARLSGIRGVTIVKSCLTQSKIFEFWDITSSTQLIENVIVSFINCLKYNSGFLQQICPHVSSYNVIVLVKGYLQVLSKSTAVVIAYCLCIPNSLKQVVISKVRDKKRELQLLHIQAYFLWRPDRAFLVSKPFSGSCHLGQSPGACFSKALETFQPC